MAKILHELQINEEESKTLWNSRLPSCSQRFLKNAR
ncbi:hypothetical protein Pint_31413 [Pistacia integerrima]|uniref:Uncharacterized protein n=1 Tax=Pistacia integerrima TaxID=434235 RepID=A0ACC0XNN0_9ROSI|nr:hypothetical protein Pint_31413 [Pistacia integerrima]